MTRGDEMKRVARLLKIPLRTLADVQADLAKAKRNKADKALADAMLRFGRLHTDARSYVENYLAVRS